VSARTRRGPRIDGPALMREAARARRKAYAPYSRFPVGAALLTGDGTVVHGCNVENASYGLTVCAERNAVFQAVARGLKDFVAIAITAAEGKGAPPCGSCRQVLHEFAPHMRVFWRDRRGRLAEETLDGLLPHAFVLKTKSKGRKGPE
jgi:cytidine deaminase